MWNNAGFWFGVFFFSQEIMNSQTFFLLIKPGFVKKRKIKACVSV